MSFVASTFVSGGRGIFSGEIFLLSNDFTRVERLYTPPYVSMVDRYPSAGKQGNRLYLAGGASGMLVMDEEFRVSRQGMGTPNAPSVSVGAGATPQIAYQRFYDQVTGEISPLSEGFAFTGDLNRVWTVLATEMITEKVIMEGLVTFNGTGGVTGDAKTNFELLRPGDRIAKASDLTRWGRVRSLAGPNSMIIDDTAIAGAGVAIVAKTVGRASHIELWLSVNGGLPRRVMRVPLGTTTVTESTATLALGSAETTSFIPMEYGAINVIYNGRQLVAGVEGHRDTIYLSAIGFPERDEGLRLITKYNEPVIGMIRYRKVVLVQTPISWYVVHGLADADYILDELEPGVGGLGHHLNVVDKKGYARIPSDDTIKIYNGSWTDAIPKRISEWSEEVAANRLAYERGFAAYNPKDGTYQIYPRFSSLGDSTSTARVWVAHGNPGPSSEGGITIPEWTSDTHTLGGGHVTFARYLIPSGASIGKFYRGTSEGKIFEEDETGSVAFVGESIIVPRFFNLNDPGGGPREGHTLDKLWLYLVSEFSGGKVQVWRGDEYCYPPDQFFDGAILRPNIATPSWPRTPATGLITASLLADGAKTYAAQTVRTYVIGLQARGFVVEVRLLNPKAAIFIGFGCEATLHGEIARDVFTEWSDPG